MIYFALSTLVYERKSNKTERWMISWHGGTQSRDESGEKIKLLLLRSTSTHCLDSCNVRMCEFYPNPANQIDTVQPIIIKGDTFSPSWAIKTHHSYPFFFYTIMLASSFQTHEDERDKLIGRIIFGEMAPRTNSLLLILISFKFPFTKKHYRADFECKFITGPMGFSSGQLRKWNWGEKEAPL